MFTRPTHTPAGIRLDRLDADQPLIPQLRHQAEAANRRRRLHRKLTVLWLLLVVALGLLLLAPRHAPALGLPRAQHPGQSPTGHHRRHRPGPSTTHHRRRRAGTAEVPLAPGPRGFRDWQREQPWDSPLLVAFAAGGEWAGNKSFGTFDVSRYARLGIFGRPNTKTLGVKLKWFLDAAGTEQTGERSFVLDVFSTRLFQALIPNLGPFVKVEMEVLGGGTALFIGRAYGTNREPPWEIAPTSAMLASGFQIFGAAGELEQSPISYWSGPAQVKLFTEGAAVAYMRVEREAGAGAWEEVDRVVANGGTLVMQRINIPFGQWRYTIVATGATTVLWTVTPFLLGSS